MLTYDKVAAVCVVGNVDGAHKISADPLPALDDVGFSLAPNAVSYWGGEAMHRTDYQDFAAIAVASAVATATLATNTAHLARPSRRLLLGFVNTETGTGGQEAVFAAQSVADLRRPRNEYFLVADGSAGVSRGRGAG
ncbi:hypothetical protein ACFTXJ_00880 [Streptomyces zhihengii]|uniref:hypothetical protein n=1 Tax=Streptomyces zhihengii TaxID=1818004 RepID=UPI003633F526